MATQNIQLGATLTVDNKQANASIDNTTKRVEKLNKTAASTKIGGSFAASKAKESTEDSTEYRVARGARGTGAEGRDFARQAQGLGGLVHVYATFAANLFAVSAAFTALSKAADYTNMVEGLNQLGAASGRNLGSMAKRMTELTDGAISLKTAMEATAQGSAAGLTGEQMERMTLVAKKASQALGRDMSDAMSRLSRGITKVEPELLDELGIMVRVDKAASDYARTLGKTTTSLTDFERRQAFAIAVLKQGEDKFKSIDLDANPFNKLLASFVNLAYQGGELLNKVLGPIAKVLAESPMALSVVMAGLTTMLISKAIPALQGWRDNIRLAAEEAEKLASSKVEKAIDIKTGDKKKLREIAEQWADEELKASEEAKKKLERAMSSSPSIKNKEDEARVNRIYAKDIEDINQRDLNWLEKKANTAGKYQKIYREINTSIRDSIELEKVATVAVEDHTRALEKAKNAPRFSIQGMNLAEAQKLQKKSQGIGIVSASIDQFSSMGWLAGWAEYDKKMEDSKKNMKKLNHSFGLLDLGILRVKTGLGMAAVAASKFVNAFGFIGVVVSSIAALYTMIDSAMTTNAKEQKDFSDSLGVLDEASKGLSRTLANISSKDPLERLSTESVQAKANAINELSNSLAKVISNLRLVDNTSSEWSKFIDGFKIAVGADIRTTTTSAVTGSFISMLDSSLNNDTKKEFQDKIKSILDIKDISSESLTKALDSLTKEEYLVRLEELDKAKTKFSNSLSNGASRLTEYKNAAQDTEKQMMNLMNSFIPTDNMSKFGMAQITQANKLAEALKEPEKALTALAETAGNIDMLKIFPPEMAQQLATLSPKLNELKAAIGTYDDLILKTQININKAQDKVNSQMKYGIYDRTSQEELINQKTQLEGLEKGKKDMYSQVEEISDKVKGAAVALYEDGSERLAKAFTQAAASAAIQVSKALLQGLEGPEITKIQYDLQLREIGVQEEVIKSQVSLIVSQEKLRLEIERSNILQEIANYKGDDPAKAKKLIESFKANTEKRNIVSSNADSIKDKVNASSNNDVKLGLQGLVASLMGANTQLAKLGGDRKVAEINTQIKLISDNYKVEQDSLKLKQESLSIQEQIYDSMSASSPMYNTELENAREKLKQDKASLTYRQAEIELDKLRVSSAYLISKAASKDKKGMQDSADRMISNKEKELDTLRRKNDADAFKRMQDLRTKEWAYIDSIIELENRRFKSKQDVENEVISLISTSNDLLTKSGLITEAESISRKTDIDLLKQQLSYEDQLRTRRQQKDKDLRAAQAIIDDANTRNNSSDIKASEVVANLRLIEGQEKYKKLIENTYSYEIASAEIVNTLKLTAIKLQGKYEESLKSTESTLKSLESSGQQFGKEYFDAVYKDFHEKVSTLLATSKSAASVLTEGIISAIDKTSDAFFEMVQKGQVTLKGIINVARQGLSDAFRDAASQTLKNSWKQLAKSIMGKTESEKLAEKAQAAAKAAQEAQTKFNEQYPSLVERQSTALSDNTKAIERLIDKLDGKTSPIAKDKLPSGGTDQYTYQPKSSEDPSSIDAVNGMDLESDKFSQSAKSQQSAASVMDNAAEKTKLNTETQIKVNQGFATDFGKLLTGQMSANDFLIKSLNSVFTWVITSLPAIGGGSSGSGGLLGTVIKAAIGSFTGSGVGLGDVFSTASTYGTNLFSEQTMRLAEDTAFFAGRYAKGGSFRDGTSLQPNSIITSPTLFAFAKGGTFNRGVGGEAGPEAIIPLKRDQQGNLGIRGGSSGDTNISINVNMETGKSESNTSGQVKPNAEQFAKNITNMIQAEMIKQKRPGGLLYV